MLHVLARCRAAAAHSRHYFVEYKARGAVLLGVTASDDVCALVEEQAGGDRRVKLVELPSGRRVTIDSGQIINHWALRAEAPVADDQADEVETAGQLIQQLRGGDSVRTAAWSRLVERSQSLLSGPQCAFASLVTPDAAVTTRNLTDQFWHEHHHGFRQRLRIDSASVAAWLFGGGTTVQKLFAAFQLLSAPSFLAVVRRAASRGRGFVIRNEQALMFAQSARVGHDVVELLPAIRAGRKTLLDLSDDALRQLSLVDLWLRLSAEQDRPFLQLFQGRQLDVQARELLHAVGYTRALDLLVDVGWWRSVDDRHAPVERRDVDALLAAHRRCNVDGDVAATGARLAAEGLADPLAAQRVDLRQTPDYVAYAIAVDQSGGFDAACSLSSSSSMGRQRIVDVHIADVVRWTSVADGLSRVAHARRNEHTEQLFPADFVQLAGLSTSAQNLAITVRMCFDNDDDDEPRSVSIFASYLPPVQLRQQAVGGGQLQRWSRLAKREMQRRVESLGLRWPAEVMARPGQLLLSPGRRFVDLLAQSLLVALLRGDDAAAVSRRLHDLHALTQTHHYRSWDVVRFFGQLAHVRQQLHHCQQLARQGAGATVTGVVREIRPSYISVRLANGLLAVHRKTTSSRLFPLVDEGDVVQAPVVKVQPDGLLVLLGPLSKMP